MKYRRDPFGDFFEIQKQMDQIFDTFLQQTVAAHSGRLSVAPEPHVWRPAIDVYETVDTFIVKMEVPGIQPDEDLRISLEGNRLTIRGTRRDRAVTKKEHYHLAEVNYGPFERIIALPDAIDEDAPPEATYDNGFLEIVLLKEARPKPRHIAVQVTRPETPITIDADEPDPLPSDAPSEQEGRSIQVRKETE